MRAADDGGGPLADLALGERDEDVDLRAARPLGEAAARPGPGDRRRAADAGPAAVRRCRSGSRRPASARIRARGAAASAGRSPADPAAPRACGAPQPDRREDGSDARTAVAALRRGRIALSRTRQWTWRGRALAGPVRRVRRRCSTWCCSAACTRSRMYFTLRLCGLTAQDWRVLPLLPMLAFFLIVDGGYSSRSRRLAARRLERWLSVSRWWATGGDGVSVGIAAGRALGAIASTLCLGAGLLPALFTRTGARCTTVSPAPRSSGCPRDRLARVSPALLEC